MSESLNILFTINLIALNLDHLVTGILALFFPKIGIKIYRQLFGVEIPPSREYLIILKPWGAMGIFAALVGLLPLFNPQKYKLILGFLIILLGTRFIVRIKHQKEALEFIKLKRERNLFHLLLIASSATLLLLQIISLG